MVTLAAAALINFHFAEQDRNKVIIKKKKKRKMLSDHMFNKNEGIKGINYCLN